MPSNVNLPAATGSGKEYTVANDSSGTITVVADTTGTADSIDGMASYDLQENESITVVDYAANNWAII